LGDDTFRRGVILYINRHRLGEVETDQFRYCLEEVSGQSLEQFFTQWCYRPGMPALDITFSWSSESDAAPGTLSVRIDQTQTIDADNPAYAFDLPILVRTSETTAQTWTVRVDSRTQSFELALPTKPLDAVVDPDLTVAAPASIEKPFAALLLPSGTGVPPVLGAVLGAISQSLRLTDAAATTESDVFLGIPPLRGGPDLVPRPSLSMSVPPLLSSGTGVPLLYGHPRFRPAGPQECSHGWSGASPRNPWKADSTGLAPAGAKETYEVSLYSDLPPVPSPIASAPPFGANP
ncbi:MAG: hypothetical protein ACKVW3_14145, partial [Phycisphaerales bacterium]